MFKLEIGKKYVCRNGEVRELIGDPVWKSIGLIYLTPDGDYFALSLERNKETSSVFNYVEPNEWDIVAEYVDLNDKN